MFLHNTIIQVAKHTNENDYFTVYTLYIVNMLTSYVQDHGDTLLVSITEFLNGNDTLIAQPASVRWSP